MAENNFNILSLTPKDEEMRVLFIEFRNNDVNQMFTYQCIFTVLFLSASIISLLKE